MTSGTQDSKDMFAEVRTLGMRNNLQVWSGENSRQVGAADVKVTVESWAAYATFASAPERAEVVLVGSLISFLECGHHCTAQNLGGKMERVARAIGLNSPKSVWDAYVVSGCWAASHPFSILAIYARCLTLAANGNLTFAITKRLHKAAPGTGAYLMLGQVLDALAEVKFFVVMGREKEYEEAKAAVAAIRRDNHLKAPYSFYLYGETRADDTRAKEVLNPMAAIASSLNDAMPGSTIGMSESFKRLTSLAAANSIMASLQVRAFVRAFSGFAERSVTSQIEGVMTPSRRLTTRALP